MQNLTKLILILFLVYPVLQAEAQLKNGTFGPDRVMEDLDGNIHRLHDILDSGKTIILDMSATWCGPCWTFHNSGVLEELHNNHSDEIAVLMVEADPETSVGCLTGGAGCNSSTQGNWTLGVPYPIINDDRMAELYEISYYPTLYAICQDRSVTLLGTSIQNILSVVNTCPEPASGENNARAHQYTGDTDYLCSNINPAFLFQNYGTNSITSATLELSINGTVVETVEWEGMLENTYDYTEVTFKEHEITDYNKVELKISNVNGAEDSDLSNNVRKEPINKATASLYEEIEITVKTDSYAAENYWALLNDAGEILIDGGNELVGLDNFSTGEDAPAHESAYDNNETYNIPFTLEKDGCYRLVITDVFGDGFCCNSGSGFLEVKNNKGVRLMKVTSELAGKLDAGFRLQREKPRADFFIEQDEDVVNVVDASALVEEWVWDFGDNTLKVGDQNPGKHTYEFNGIYDVCLTVSNFLGEDQKCVEVEITTAKVAINEVDVLNQIKLTPNPAGNFVQINSSEFDNSIEKIEIIGTDGKIYQAIETNLFRNNLVLNIKELNNGIYFVNLLTNDTIFTKRLTVAK